MLDFSQFDIKGLDILYDVHERMCEGLIQKVQSEEDKESVKHKENITQLGYLLIQLQVISDEINKKQQENLIYSVEDIYKFAGQTDKYIVCKFYKTSDAFKKYGDEAYGNLIYQKKQRDILEEIISNEKYQRTDGRIFLDGASKNSEKNTKLKNEGFLASEIFEMLTLDHTGKEKQYRKDGQKEIPHTINITFDPTDIDLEKMQIHLAINRLNDGYKLMNHELIELYSNLYILEPNLVNDEMKNLYLLNNDKKDFNKEAEFKIYSIKNRRGLATPEEIILFKQLLRERRIERFELVKNELGISNKQLEKFKETFPEKYQELFVVILTFSTETLTIHKTDFPIYWDFERFIHIYLRHYKDFFIEASTARGTHFQYSYKDIKRVAKLIIENLKDEIEEALNNGKPYAKYGDKGYYFNGNYYTLRIDSQGRLMQFHPLE